MIESAGLLMFKRYPKVEIFLVHPGGPYWQDQDRWGIPKGQLEANEGKLQGAIREFEEETSIEVKTKVFNYLGAAKTSTKLIHAWSFEFDFSGQIKSNIVQIEYPAKSGKLIDIEEVDAGRYFSIEEAKEKIHKSQLPILNNFEKYIIEIGDKNEKKKNLAFKKSTKEERTNS